MSKKNSKELFAERYVSRRQFLYGAGSALVLPTLASMLPEAVAQSLSTEQKLRLCLLPTEYGMVTSHLLGKAENHPQWQIHQASPRIRYGSLSQISGDISYVVDSKLDALRNHMNLYEGLDLMSGAGHSFGAFTGSQGGRIGNHGRSIDVIIENSIAFKKSFKGKMAVIRHGNSSNAGGFCMDRKRDANGNLLNGESNCIKLTNESKDGKIFEKLFMGNGQIITPPSGTGMSRRQLVVDLILEDYKSLKNHRRISGSDKVLLDQYINTLFEIQSNLLNPVGSTIACTNSPPGYRALATNEDNAEQYWKNVFSMAVAAFACDQSRIFSSLYHPSNSMHHDADDSATEMNGSKHQKVWIDRIVKYLVTPMMNLQDPFGGGSLLDNSLVIWTNEHAGRSHGHGGVPVMSFGKLGGHIRTGYAMDFNQAHTDPNYVANPRKIQRRGFPMKMMLVSIMQAMGVTNTEILREGDGNGFGSWSTYFGGSAEKPSHFIKEMYDLSYFSTRHSTALPFFTKT